MGPPPSRRRILGAAAAPAPADLPFWPLLPGAGDPVLHGAHRHPHPHGLRQPARHQAQVSGGLRVVCGGGGGGVEEAARLWGASIPPGRHHCSFLLTRTPRPLPCLPALPAGAPACASWARWVSPSTQRPGAGITRCEAGWPPYRVVLCCPAALPAALQALPALVVAAVRRSRLGCCACGCSARAIPLDAWPQPQLPLTCSSPP